MMELRTALTTHVGTRLELGRHLGIHRDHHLLLFGHELVPLFDLLADPLLERLADDCSAHVDDPLLGHMREVWLVRKVRLDPRLASNKGKDLLQREALVVRQVEILHIFVVQLALLPGDDVFEKVDGHIV